MPKRPGAYTLLPNLVTLLITFTPGTRASCPVCGEAPLYTHTAAPLVKRLLASSLSEPNRPAPAWHTCEPLGKHTAVGRYSIDDKVAQRWQDVGQRRAATCCGPTVHETLITQGPRYTGPPCAGADPKQLNFDNAALHLLGSVPKCGAYSRVHDTPHKIPCR